MADDRFLFDRFLWFAWMSPYYRKMSGEPGFAAMDTTARWTALRERIVNDKPEGLAGQLEAIDAVHQAERADLLEWLRASL